MAINPSIIIEEFDERYIKLWVKNVSLAYANSLRWIIMSEVPTMAIEFVNIYENTSPLADE